MKRRTFVTATGAISVGGLTALSGCNAPTGDGGNGDGGNGDGTTEADGAGGTTTEAGGGTTAEGTTQQGGGTTQVRMVTEGDQFYFDPVGLFVEPGTSVEWVNDSGSHSSTAYAPGNGGAEVRRIPEDAEAWDSGILTEQGATFSYTFEVQGTYDYFCIPHKSLGMVARIVCGEPGGVEGDPPDGPVPSEQAIVDRGPISHDEFSG